MQSNDMITVENCKNVIKCICEKVGWNFDLITSKTRKAEIVRIRIVLIGLLHPRYAYSTLATAFNRDHTSILHSYNHTRYDMIDGSGRIFDNELYELYNYVAKIYQECKENTIC